MGCDHDSRITSLEQRVLKLETDSHNKQVDDNDRHSKLEDCINIAADNAYWRYVEQNGKSMGNGVYRAPDYVWNSAMKLKQQKIEECKILYGK